MGKPMDRLARLLNEAEAQPNRDRGRYRRLWTDDPALDDPEAFMDGEDDLAAPGAPDKAPLEDAEFDDATLDDEDMEPGAGNVPNAEEDAFPPDHPSPQELSAEDPPEPQSGDPFGKPGDLAKVSPFDQFITNQLLDFPAEDVAFTREEGAFYVDAKFGDKAVSFCLYKGEEGQPLLGVLYDEEVYRTELPAEALSGDGKVRDEFMPIDWIRDILAKLIDVAPEFECYRFDKQGRKYPVQRRAVPLRERLERLWETAPKPVKTKGVKGAGVPRTQTTTRTKAGRKALHRLGPTHAKECRS